jgi:hypothetical protein
MHLDLTDEETFTLLNLLTETIENDRYPSPHSHLAWHSRQVRPGRAGTPPRRRPGRPHQKNANRAEDHDRGHGGGIADRYRSRITLRSKSRSAWVMDRSLRKQNPLKKQKKLALSSLELDRGNV